MFLFLWDFRFIPPSSNAQVRLFAYECANQDHTIDVLERLGAEFPGVSLKLVWDRAPYHRAYSVSDRAQELGIIIQPYLLIVLILCPWNIFGNGCVKMLPITLVTRPKLT